MWFSLGFHAVRDNTVSGFADYDVLSVPEGVAAAEGERSIGSALLLASLHAQLAQCDAYSIIGGVRPAEIHTSPLGS
ncbi:MAG: hypothetical protein ABI624_16615 [Casimicrobiaceae bacterium]